MPPPTRKSVNQFVELTGTTMANATTWLSHYNNNFEQALDAYLSKKSGQGETSSALEAIFAKYKDPEGEDIGIDGTIAYIEDLGFEPEDVSALILAEFLESPSVGIFKKDAFVRKWTALNVESVSEMAAFIELEKKRYAGNKDYFKQVYEYTFTIALDANARVLSNEVAVEYWNLLLAPVYGAKLALWVKFVVEEWKKTINRDAWTMLLPFLEWFSQQTSLAEYDETAAWPSLIDAFVEYVNSHEFL
ncbi:hypothetical protein BABINDRAFT_67496 [Babjeviella inositovora NRRL Y-12698]|uniref:Defective in cullin neddylation protein n=1 Tax=Babjeviella inositovora NRRL Y-12698 TaxID=984486 RepID=A0A1E3QI35_9ASCO|nr:uncharacterized protein BABINDRAFT_67496 [Babjeviella inositovora NRRL Y-12698]ODQ77361.1 hypothetical protein BABINDRAFT_67496 [Babjeviella inositovora NRRL Y-12698]